MTTVTSVITTVGRLTATARHELFVAGPIGEVFELTRDVTRWREYMPAVTGARFVEQNETGDIVEITAEANDQRHTWRSRRIVDPAARTIDFSRIDAQPPLREMTGRWEFIQADDDTGALIRYGTRAVLTHRYATTTEEAFTFFRNATRSNATRDLEGLAELFRQAGAA